MRLWPANRFVTAAEMSAPEPGTASCVGSHCDAFHWSANGNLYSRVSEIGMNPNGPGVGGDVRASAVRALLPWVVNVGVPVAGSTSHGPREAVVFRPTSQPAASRKQPTIRLSPAGAALKYCHDGLPAALGAPATVLTA